MRDDSWWRWCSNNNEHTCHWHWRNSFNPHTSTAIATQIVQTWLEAQALARATPQSTGPGIPVTFDHSWSHILDPLTSLTRFRWNVDGVDGWDFTTDRVDETFEYTFSANLGGTMSSVVASSWKSPTLRVVPCTTISPYKSHSLSKSQTRGRRSPCRP